MAWGPKDPEAIRDYGIDWTADLGNETITASSWEISAGTLTQVAVDFGDYTTTIRLSGGVDGETYTLTNHITLSNGEEDEQSVELLVQDR